MPGDLNPLRPNLSNAGGPGGDGLRNAYDQRGNRGGGGKGGQQKDEPEPEAKAPAEPAEEEGHLDADSFKGRNARQMIDNLFADALPWEEDAALDDKATRLELLRKLRDEQASAPRLRGPAAVPPRRTGPIPPPHPAGRQTGGLGGVKVPAVPTGPDIPALPPTHGGRRVDENFDPTAGVNSALLAQQEIAQRAAMRTTMSGVGNSARGQIPGVGAIPPPPIRGTGELSHQRGTGELPGLAKVLRQDGGRGTGALPPITGARAASPEEATTLPPLAMPRPEIEQLPEGARNSALDAARRATGPIRVRPPSVAELSGEAIADPTPAAAPRVPRAVPPPARPTGRIDPAAAAEARGAALDAARQRAGTGPTRPPAAQPPAPAPRADGGLPAHATPRGPAARKPEPAPEAAPAPSWLQEPIVEEPPAWTPDALEAEATVAAVEPEVPAAAAVPETHQWPGKAPKVAAGTVSSACTYRVIDVGTNKPLQGARIELEPVHDDDMLPNLHGQVDAYGWYGEEGLPPGEYRVTVRAPGYVPVFKVRHLEPGVVDDLAIFIAKP